jgi:alkanesulfonate monooxygenase SsuD/methylene tetrahydromethanopterin reductase-like flavin-dependent oxidoreductase (luciferase family)
VKHALYLPPFAELADPRVLRDLAAAAEESGWEGFFLWDHVLRPPDEVDEIADVWVSLAAVAAATTTLRLGPMVTPLVRRRVQKVAREVVTLDLLSSGRLTVGLGLGVDSGGELSKFGELTDERARGDLLDEGAGLLDALMSGEEVSHHGEYFTVDATRFLPRPVQQPRVPLWFATRGAATRPVRRAARYDGVFPIEIDGDGLSRVIDVVVAERGSLDDFDVAVLNFPGVDIDDMARRGATWSMWSFLPGEPAAEVAAFIERGPRSQP